MQTGETSYRIRLQGWFAPSWIVGLCAELARCRLSIVSGHVLRKVDQTWVAELEVDAEPEAVDPLTISYLDLTELVRDREVQPLCLIRYTVEETLAPGGALHVTIEADDTLGLLGSMLAELALLLLFPVELHIETRSGRAYDSFWLNAVGGAQPAPDVRTSLERALGRACAR
ncbi:MAG: hypothetical protein JWN04_2626 [Myxococcaceae bacterium]|nr:hypothetical protein [Myxococcaceae bacterium]